MTKEIRVRKAEPHEIDWVNLKYDEVKYRHSNYENDFIAIAEFDGEKAGMGRLQKINENCAELGGMYVFEEFRRKGIAGELVRCLLDNSKQYHRVFCLPFEYVSDFYRQFGFVDASDDITPPEYVTEKHRWCNEFYSGNTLLFYLDN